MTRIKNMVLVKLGIQAPWQPIVLRLLHQASGWAPDVVTQRDYNLKWLRLTEGGQDE